VDLVFFEVRDSRLPKNQHWEYGEAHPDPLKFPDHELVYVAPNGDSPGWQRWYYAAKRSEQHVYNWEWSNTPEWPQIKQTFFVRREEFDQTATYAAPPAGDINLTGFGVVSTSRREIDSAELRSMFVLVDVVREEIYLNTGPVRSPKALTGVAFDEETGEARPWSKIKVFAGTSGESINSSGQFATVDPINTLWSIKTTRKAAGLAGAAIKTRTLNTIVDYYWPPVLQQSKMLIEAFPRKEGPSAIKFRYSWTREPYSGPCYAEVIETWTLIAPNVLLPTVMQPMEIQYSGPNLQFSIPPSLHAQIQFGETIAANDPVWDAPQGTTYKETYPATNPDNWPSFVIASYSVRPMSGGFLSRRVNVYNPTHI
jgi:hypothetical protein